MHVTKIVEKSAMTTDFCENIIPLTFLSSQYRPPDLQCNCKSLKQSLLGVEGFLVCMSGLF